MSTDDKNAPTDTSRHTQTAPVSVWGCLLASFVICCRLLSSVDILSSMEMSGGVFRGCLGVSEGYSWKLEALRRVWGVTGIPVLTVWSRNIILAQPWNAQLFLLDQTKASKYQNVFVKGLQKSLGYGIFLFFSAHQKEIINYSCNRSPCMYPNTEIHPVQCCIKDAKVRVYIYFTIFQKMFFLEYRQIPNTHVFWLKYCQDIKVGLNTSLLWIWKSSASNLYGKCCRKNFFS